MKLELDTKDLPKLGDSPARIFHLYDALGRMGFEGGRLETRLAAVLDELENRRNPPTVRLAEGDIVELTGFGRHVTTSQSIDFDALKAQGYQVTGVTKDGKRFEVYGLPNVVATIGNVANVKHLPGAVSSDGRVFRSDGAWHTKIVRSNYDRRRHNDRMSKYVNTLAHSKDLDASGRVALRSVIGYLRNDQDPALADVRKGPDRRKQAWTSIVP